jgi:hypothetical protein
MVGYIVFSLQATEAPQGEGIIDLFFYTNSHYADTRSGGMPFSKVLAMDRLFFLALTALWGNTLLVC